MNLLELNHVEKSFGDLSVLKDISLSVSEGEIVSIIGPSGSGKSTLLRCATMLETMDHGEIVERGTHEELLEKQGKYYELWSLQQGIFRDQKRGEKPAPVSAAKVVEDEEDGESITY